MTYSKKVFLLTVFFISFHLFSEIELNESQTALLDSLPPDQRSNILTKMEQASSLEGEIQDAFDAGATTMSRPEKKILSDKQMRDYLEKSKDWVYGYELFTKAPTTFAPGAENIPVKDDYVLGPGDKIKVEMFGSTSQSVAEFIDRNGVITIPNLGPVTISGLTLKDARELVSKKVSEGLIGADVFLSLGELRSINIYVLGAAYQPGSYTVSSLTSVTNALFVSGGVSESGSLRHIQIKRQGKLVGNFDFYDLILRGDTSEDISLKEGDVIFIPFLEKTARTNGSFNNPGLFEIKESETLEDLIFFSGAIKVEATNKPKFELSRLGEDGTRLRKEFGKNSSILKEKIQDGDYLSVHSLAAAENLTVELKGEFKYPGFYSVSPKESVSDLINRAGGFTDNSYPHGTIFTRKSVAKSQKLSFERSADYIEQAIADTLMSGTVEVTPDSMAPVSSLVTRLREIEPIGRQIIEADPYVLKSKPQLDLTLEDGDVIHTPKRPVSITVVGEVRNPTTHTYQSGFNPLEYVSRSGGFKKTADRKGLFLLLPNGETKEINSRLFSRSKTVQLLPGSTIVVPRSPKPFDWLEMTTIITPILADTATVIATVKALADD